MADLDLDAIERRAVLGNRGPTGIEAAALVAEVRRLRAIIRKARPRVVQPHMDGGAHLGFTSCVVTGDELTAVIRAEQEAGRG